MQHVRMISSVPYHIRNLARDRTNGWMEMWIRRPVILTVTCCPCLPGYFYTESLTLKTTFCLSVRELLGCIVCEFVVNPFFDVNIAWDNGKWASPLSYNGARCACITLTQFSHCEEREKGGRERTPLTCVAFFSYIHNFDICREVVATVWMRMQRPATV